MKYFNAHAHTFNMQDVPDGFLKVKLPDRFANFVHWILSHDVSSKIFFWVANKLIRKGTTAKAIAFLAIGVKKTQDMVFVDLLANYPTGDDVKCIILPLDFTHMGAGPLRVPYAQQLEDLFEVQMKYPNQCFPFVAIDPRSGTSGENRDFVKRYIDRGFSGIKIYPALGYFAFDEAMFDVYKYAQENNIPLMTHCSSGGINYVGDTAPQSFVKPKPFPPLNPDDYYFPQKEGQKMSDYCDQFNDPTHFREVLQTFPQLKMCFAHMGLSGRNKIGPKRPEKNQPLFQWYKIIKELMDEYKNVYTDISYSVAYPGFCDWFKKEFDTYSADMQDRVLFGTDFFMTVQEDKGKDKEIFDTVIKELGIPLFRKLSGENVERYLNLEIA